MSRRTGRTAASIATAAVALTTLAALLPAAAGAAATPVWKLSLSSQPTHFVPGGTGRYLLVATNVGAETASGPITVTDTVPTGLTPLSANTSSNDPATPGFSCSVAPPTVSCNISGPVHAGFSLAIEIRVGVGSLADPSLLIDEAEISGGGAASAKRATPTTISATSAPFGFLAGQAGFAAPLIEEDGSPATEAGGHPHEAISDLGFPTVEPTKGLLTSAGHPRDITVDFPPGMVANPAATPVLCTEAELITENLPGCPPTSAVGTVTVTTDVAGGVGPKTSPLYNMVPPPGTPAALGFDAAGVGIFVHVLGDLRSDGDYGLSGSVHDVIARGLNPVFAASVELWGDPTSKSHDFSRGNCLFGSPPPCDVAPQSSAFLALPVDCPGEPLLYGAFADSWEEPGPENEREAEYESADLAGDPVSVEGCNGLDFEPTIQARPTTNLADSPTGLDVDLHQPQELDLKGRYTTSVRDAVVTFPPGLSVNASSADGLEVCTNEQIGFEPEENEIHFSKVPASCPDGAKIGTVEAATPLLAQYDPQHKVQHDPGTGQAIAEPLHGSVYLAKPFDNPFGSLIAVYLTIEDEKTGIVAKLAGEVEPSSVTGQLSTTFLENPELPVEDIKVHIFDGPRGGLQTPTACGAHTTSADLAPWSAPEGTDAHPTDSFQITAAPAGGACPAQAPNTPVLRAGTISSAAGSFSPLLFKLTREDGSQRLSGLEVTLPPGLSAKLAGVGQCSEAQIAVARARSNPNEGAVEQVAPSCPAASELGVVTVGSGAGPTPLYVRGHAYLAGPYKGAPLSTVIITPAVAGPFDLGVVVARAAVYLDPVTAKARAVSDPLPQILQGIPIDVRSVTLRVDRSNFTLNPTSCSEKTFVGTATSTLGHIAPLSERFQVGGCSALRYKPKLHTRLFGPIHRGGHPRLRSVFEAKPGEAGTARISFALPRSEFIDQGHFRTVCTRVQFAASQCPPGSIYGHVVANTPLVDYPLEGPIYLRSSSHKLPDIVVALRGPSSQPIEIDLVGRVDSINGGIRFTFDGVPDAPVSKVVVTAQGGKKGLFQNSTNICKGTNRATLKLDGQNGKTHDIRPLLKASCQKTHQPKQRGRH